LGQAMRTLLLALTYGVRKPLRSTPAPPAHREASKSALLPCN
jgi:hypothetical protein